MINTYLLVYLFPCVPVYLPHNIFAISNTPFAFGMVKSSSTGEEGMGFGGMGIPRGGDSAG